MYGFMILGVYEAVMLAATFIFARRESGNEDFMVADRNMETVSSAMSIAATWIWAPALFVSAKMAYTNGIPGLFWFLVPNILCLLIFTPFARRIRKQMPNGITLSGYIGERYHNRPAKRVYEIQLGLLAILSTAVQLLAGGKILASTTGMNFTLVTVILALIALSYSVISGIRASVMTDAVQMIFMLIACAIFVPWALGKPGGTADLMKGLPGITGEYGHLFGRKGIEVMIGYGIPQALGLISGPFGDQCFWQRAFSIREDKVGKAFRLGTFFFAVVPASMGILGYIAAGSGYIAKDSGIVNVELIQHLFPSWTLFPFLFMLISGLLSTVDSNLCAAASLTTDFQKGDQKTSVWSMVILLVLGIGIANIPGMTVTGLFLVYGVLRSTTLLPTIITLLKDDRRTVLSGSGVAAGVAISLATGVPLFAYATIKSIPWMKTVTSIYTMCISGIIALLLSRKGGRDAD